MKLSVPDVLKVVLVDDWEAITKNNQVKKKCQISPHSWPEMLAAGFPAPEITYCSRIA